LKAEERRVTEFPHTVIYLAVEKLRILKAFLCLKVFHIKGTQNAYKNQHSKTLKNGADTE
jgi:hypothetical protein